MKQHDPNHRERDESTQTYSAPGNGIGDVAWQEERASTFNQEANTQDNQEAAPKGLVDARRAAKTWRGEDVAHWREAAQAHKLLVEDGKDDEETAHEKRKQVHDLISCVLGHIVCLSFDGL